MENRVFNTKGEFYKFISEIANNFDLNRSMRSNENSFVTKDGKHINSLHFAGFLKNLNEVLGTSFDFAHSRHLMNSYVIILDVKKQVNKEDKKENSKPSVKKESEQPNDVTDSKDFADTDNIVDKAKSFYNEDNKKESKDKLASFAEDKGYNLDKRQTFEAMIEQLEKLISE